jgi:hypothetical protein
MKHYVLNTYDLSISFVSGQLHNSAALPPLKEPPVPVR